jgi:HD-GYP domain-containing protein (c-di-GMP phosphodiesterase class II)
MQDLERKARRLELLARLGIELNSERDFDRLLVRIWHELTEVLEAERSSLFLLDEDTDELYSVIAQQEAEIRFPRGAGIAGSVAASGQSLLIPDAYKDPRFNPDVDRKTGFKTRSLLTVPLKNSRHHVLGVAQVLNRRDGEPFDQEDQHLLEALASLSGTAIETLQLIDEQQKATEAVITGLVIALEMRVPHERMHSLAVRAYSGALARQMGLPELETKRIEWAAALHDIGKLAVPDRVLTKAETPTDEERELYESHALRTQEFLEAMEFTGELSGVESIAPYHHKRYAGGGYPEGDPDGSDVPLGARIIGVADALWVRMNPRFGMLPMSQADAVRWITRQAGSDFDPAVAEALEALGPKLEELRFEVARKAPVVRGT